MGECFIVASFSNRVQTKLIGMSDTKTKRRAIRIAQLWIYPLKSASPIRVESTLLDTWGMQYDRIYMLVEEDKKYDNMFKSMSQKRYPKVSGKQFWPEMVARSTETGETSCPDKPEPNFPYIDQYSPS